MTKTVLVPGVGWPGMPAKKRRYTKKLSPSQVLEVRSLAALHFPYKYLEVKYKVSRYTLYDIINQLGAYAP